MKRPLLCICALIVGLVILWQAICPPDLQDHPLAGERVVLFGRVTAKELKTSSEQEKFVLYLSDVILYSDMPQIVGARSKEQKDIMTETMTMEKQVMVYFACDVLRGDALPEIGRYVLAEGELTDFDRPRNPGEFDSRLYYASLGIGMRMYSDDMLILGEGYNRFAEWLWQIRETCASILMDRLGPKQGSVLATMLLGRKEYLDTEMKGLYQQSGISHVLAISGLHISLVGMGIYTVLRKIGLPIWMSAMVGMAGVLLFGMFVGAGASALRAAGMFLIRMLGILLRQNYDMLTSLGLLLALMVLENPLYLYQSGFLLSFGAMVGIGCVYPLLIRREKTHIYREGWNLFFYKLVKGTEEALILSFSVMIVALPVMCMSFFEIAPYGMVINLLILPLVPVLFVLGFLLILVNAWEISTILCGLTNLVLNGYSRVAELSMGLPYSRVIVGGVNIYQLLFYLIVLGILILCGKRISRQGCFKLIIIAIIAMTVRVNFGAEIYFLNVGQGDGIFMQTGKGSCYMIDGGSSSKKEIGKYTIAPFLKSKGVREIDAWIITHPDTDHCNGLADTLEAGYGKRVKRILLPSAMDASRGGTENVTENEAANEIVEYRTILALAEQYDIPVYFLSAGMQWQEDDAGFLCLNPPLLSQIASQTVELSANEYSLVFYLELGKYSFLLTGDVEKTGEKYLITELQKRGITHVDVLKVAHHGSRYSTTEAFLEVLDADLAVISCGENNVYGHPHRETIERLKKDGCLVWNIAERGWTKLD